MELNYNAIVDGILDMSKPYNIVGKEEERLEESIIE
jgi:hypothetical protein